MNIETYTSRVQQLSLNVVQTAIDSIRKKDITKTGVRAYEEGKIGVAGAIGRYDEGDLTQQAAAALALGIPYPYDLSADRVEAVEPESDLPQGPAFVDEMEQMLAELAEAQPSFSFSNRITLNTQEVRLSNDRGLDLRYSSTSIDTGLLIKDKGSANLFDAYVGYSGWQYERAAFTRLANAICDAYRREVDIEEGTHPVFFVTEDYAYRTKLMESLNGLLYGTGGSLFSGKMGQKLFADRFTVYQTRHWEDEILSPFFDMEGTVKPGYRLDLIREGVLAAVMTDKKHATKYGLPLSGAAGGDYDSVPSLGMAPMRIASTGQTMAELLDGRKGILVWIASGGDFTPDGHFATPVQLAFLFDGETMVGRLPELNVSSHLYDMFGKDLIGVSSDSLTSLAKLDTIAMNMHVRKSK